MNIIRELLQSPPYSLPRTEKKRLYDRELFALTLHHFNGCPEYQRILHQLHFDPNSKYDTTSLPFIPVRLFKAYDLKSIDSSKIVNTLVSSGTTGQQVSRINLDETTGIHQKKILGAITANFIGETRLPMLILDTKAVLKNRSLFSARGAGIMGFSLLGKNLTYALDEQMNLDLNAIAGFIERFREGPVLLFGFTFMIWSHFIQALKRKNIKLELDQGILIHGGGWKKLENEAIDNDSFKQAMLEVSSIKRIHNYYGMVEQTGSIFMECEHGRFHCSNYSDILIRRSDFSLCDINEPGLIELLSLAPYSYPGHILLTEDQGAILGEDDCPCGRYGKTFKVFGRIKQAEIRGCSDTYSA